jgi:hypothetical protein
LPSDGQTVNHSDIFCFLAVMFGSGEAMIVRLFMKSPLLFLHEIEAWQRAAG